MLHLKQTILQTPLELLVPISKPTRWPGDPLRPWTYIKTQEKCVNLDCTHYAGQLYINIYSWVVRPFLECINIDRDRLGQIYLLGVHVKLDSETSMVYLLILHVKLEDPIYIEGQFYLVGSSLHVLTGEQVVALWSLAVHELKSNNHTHIHNRWHTKDSSDPLDLVHTLWI